MVEEDDEEEEERRRRCKVGSRGRRRLRGGIEREAGGAKHRGG